jgi:hypothetical protein
MLKLCIWKYMTTALYIFQVQVHHLIRNLNLLLWSIICNTPTTTSSKTSATADITVSQRLSKSSRSGSLKNFLDSLGNDEEAKINNALAEFVFGCNVLFSIVESNCFREFIEKLRPSYVEKLPCQKTLSTTILDRTYEDCLA